MSFPFSLDSAKLWMSACAVHMACRQCSRALIPELPSGRAEQTGLLSCSQDFLQCETGSATAQGKQWGRRELFSSPFHFSHCMKEALRLFQAASSSTPSSPSLIPN